MNNKIMKKIRSERGASITFALLLFLVCMVMCSVIVVAATTTSGRLSKMAESDQEYYAVISAAELIKEIMESRPVKLEKIFTGTRTETYENGSTDIKIVYDTTYTFKLDDVTVFEAAPSFDTLLSDVAYKYYKGGGTMNLTIESSNEMKNQLGLTSEDPLQVAINEVVSSSGDVTFIIGGDYKIVLEFSISETGPSSVETPGTRETEVESQNKYTIRTDMTKTDTTTLTWALTAIK